MTKEQELRLLKNILEEGFEPHFFIRLRELDPEYASQLQIHDKKKTFRRIRISFYKKFKCSVDGFLSSSKLSQDHP